MNINQLVLVLYYFSQNNITAKKAFACNIKMSTLKV